MDDRIAGPYLFGPFFGPVRGSSLFDPVRDLIFWYEIQRYSSRSVVAPDQFSSATDRTSIPNQLSSDYGSNQNLGPIKFGPRTGSNKIRTEISDNLTNTYRNSYLVRADHLWFIS